MISKRRRRGARTRQTELDLRPKTHGGARTGAGRKPGPGRRPTPHARRPEVRRNQPRHVVLRVRPEVGRLRRPAAYDAIRGAIATVIGRLDFRIVHASIQGNHLHLLVEADDKNALTRGVRAFMISAARRLNAACHRKGPVFDGRYHATAIASPRQARHALAYVLNNWRRHGEHRAGPAQQRALVDPYSSSILFDGWREHAGRFDLPAGYLPLPVAGARTWLFTTGWRTHSPIGLREVPGGQSAIRVSPIAAQSPSRPVPG